MFHAMVAMDEYHTNKMWLFRSLLCLCAIFQLSAATEPTYGYKTLTLPVPLDHFSYDTNATFDLRYLINDTFWKQGGPIFFYTGNEGDIELFAKNTGLMWEIAPEFSALLIFAEHRYYGKSLPFQDKSFSDLKHLGYLSSAQALADYVYLLNYLQGQLKNKESQSPVITFGGSYGGMLAAWMRLKYPWIINGAVASSAPIYQFQDLTKCNTYSNIVADVFRTSSRTGACAKNIKSSWKAIRNTTSTKEGKDWLSKEWKLCQALNSTDDVGKLIDAVNDVFNNVAMINYPYPTDFLMAVPAHPVRAMCEKLEDKHLDVDDKPLLTAFGKAVSVYTNYTGSTKCFNLNNTDGNLLASGWGFQACTEMVMPMCVDAKNEMFEPQTWDFKKYADDCYKAYGVRMNRDDVAVLEYGGKQAEYSNVIFTNGLLDPWSPGGVLKTNISSVYTMVIPEAAHHLDLRASNHADPGSVVQARKLIRNILHMWLKTIKSNSV